MTPISDIHRSSLTRGPHHHHHSPPHHHHADRYDLEDDQIDFHPKNNEQIVDFPFPPDDDDDDDDDGSFESHDYLQEFTQDIAEMKRKKSGDDHSAAIAIAAQGNSGSSNSGSHRRKNSRSPTENNDRSESRMVLTGQPVVLTPSSSYRLDSSDRSGMSRKSGGTSGSHRSYGNNNNSSHQPDWDERSGKSDKSEDEILRQNARNLLLKVNHHEKSMGTSGSSNRSFRSQHSNRSYHSQHSNRSYSNAEYPAVGNTKDDDDDDQRQVREEYMDELDYENSGEEVEEYWFSVLTRKTSDFISGLRGYLEDYNGYDAGGAAGEGHVDLETGVAVTREGERPKTNNNTSLVLYNGNSKPQNSSRRLQGWDGDFPLQDYNDASNYEDDDDQSNDVYYGKRTVRARRGMGYCLLSIVVIGSTVFLGSILFGIIYKVATGGGGDKDSVADVSVGDIVDLYNGDTAQGKVVPPEATTATTTTVSNKSPGSNNEWAQSILGEPIETLQTYPHEESPAEYEIAKVIETHKASTDVNMPDDQSKMSPPTELKPQPLESSQPLVPQQQPQQQVVSNTIEDVVYPPSSLSVESNSNAASSEAAASSSQQQQQLDLPSYGPYKLSGLQIALPGITLISSQQVFEWEYLTSMFIQHTFYNDAAPPLEQDYVQYNVREMEADLEVTNVRYVEGSSTVVTFTQTSLYKCSDGDNISVETVVNQPFSAPRYRAAYVDFLRGNMPDTFGALDAITSLSSKSEENYEEEDTDAVSSVPLADMLFCASRWPVVDCSLTIQCENDGDCPEDQECLIAPSCAVLPGGGEEEISSSSQQEQEQQQQQLVQDEQQPQSTVRQDEISKCNICEPTLQVGINSIINFNGMLTDCANASDAISTLYVADSDDCREVREVLSSTCCGDI